jgi:hypothetical protein
VWDDVPEGPLRRALDEAIDGTAVRLSVGGGATLPPPDTEVCVLPPAILPAALRDAPAALPALRALVLPCVASSSALLSRCCSRGPAFNPTSRTGRAVEKGGASCFRALFLTEPHQMCMFRVMAGTPG